jgi:hypothetical protein
LALEVAPRVVAWVETIDDLSGLEIGDVRWQRNVPDTLRALLTEAGRVYAPLLLANAAALDSGRAGVECEIDGRPWRQKPFRYQGKCLGWLREHRAALDAAQRDEVDRALEGTGCEVLFRA